MNDADSDSTRTPTDTPATAAPTPPARLVAVEVSGPIARLTLRDPARRNVLGLDMMNAVIAAVRAAAARADVAVLVLTGEGPVLSAGHHLAEMLGRTLEDERVVFARCVEMMELLQSIRQPVIAEVQGHAIAAGCQLVATCDLAIAVDTAVFGTPGVKIGLFCSTPMVAVTRAIGRKRALQLLFTGQTIDAATAADWGLINAAVPAADLRATVDELALRIAAASPLTVKIGKQAFYRQIDLPQGEAYLEMAEVMARNSVTSDAQEGMSAFLEKRRPVWRGV